MRLAEEANGGRGPEQQPRPTEQQPQRTDTGSRLAVAPESLIEPMCEGFLCDVEVEEI